MMVSTRALSPCSARRVAVLALLALLAAGPAASAQSGAKKAVSQETVTTADGWTIPITYYQSDEGKEAAVVILLHQEKGKRLDWEKNGFAKQLQDRGYAVLVPDLRKHGEAKHPNERMASGELRALDYKAIASATPTGDLEAIKDFLFEEHQKGNLNMAKTGLVAASDMAPVALQWAEYDWAKRPYNDAPTLAASTPRGQDVKAIVLLSPRERVTGMSAAQSLKALSAMPAAFLILHSDNNADTRDAARIHQGLTSMPGADKRVYLMDYPGKLRGTDLLSDRLRGQKIDELMIGFFERHLKQVEHAPQLNVEWRDRRSRLAR